MKTARIARFAAASALLAAIALPRMADARERIAPPADVLDLDATVSSEVAPDLSVVTLAVVREGPEVASLTRDVNETLAKAFADAKAVGSVIAASGGYSTFPRIGSRGGTNTRTGWQLRAEIIVKSKDFDALGALVGKLSQTLQIAGSGFEISPELRAREGSALIERGVHAFQDKASAAAKAFGYSGYSIRQVSVGSAGQSGGGRISMARMDVDAAASQSPAALPVESGRVTLSLTVSGSVLMRR